MNFFEIKKILPKNFPNRIVEIPDKPKQLFYKGKIPPENYKWLTVVGSRKYSTYGHNVCEKLIQGLKGYPIIIVSGLALGIDSIALENALAVNLQTVGVPGSGLKEKVLYPPSSKNLADRIIKNGGTLISEFKPDQEATKWTFPQRNRIMAGLSDAVLLIEAEERSGTMITARLASEYNRDVFVVPGSIFSENTSGNHKLLKLGATLIRNSNDIIDSLNLKLKEKQIDKNEINNLSLLQKLIWQALSEPIPKDELFQKINSETSEISSALSILEIKGLIKESLGLIRRI